MCVAAIATFGCNVSTDEEAAEAPQIVKPEAGGSLGIAVMQGFYNHRGDAGLLTSCDGLERVTVETTDARLQEKLTVAASGGLGFVVLKGERFQRTQEQTDAGIDGVLKVSDAVEIRSARAGDCDLEYAVRSLNGAAAEAATALVEDPVLHRAAAVLGVRGDGDPGLGLERESLIEARLVEATVAWCGEAQTREKSDPFRIDWQVVEGASEAHPTGRFLGAWTLSCGRARYMMRRLGQHGTFSAVQPDEPEGTPLTGPGLDLRTAAQARTFAPWASNVKPSCADGVCPGDALPATE